MDYYHSPRHELVVGNVLKPTFYCDTYHVAMLPAMLLALEQSPQVVKCLLELEPMISLFVEKPEGRPTNWMSGILLEAMFEKVRDEEFNDQPKRIGAMFLCLNEKDAQQVKGSYQRSARIAGRPSGFWFRWDSLTLPRNGFLA